MRDGIRSHALVAIAAGAAMLLAPASALGAGRPVKPGPCTVSGGVTVQAVKVKGVTTLYVTGTAGTDVSGVTIRC